MSPEAGEQQSPWAAEGLNTFAICWASPMERERRFCSSLAQRQKAKGCQVLRSQLCWLMLPSGGETPPKTSAVLVADRSERDLPQTLPAFSGFCIRGGALLLQGTRFPFSCQHWGPEQRQEERQSKGQCQGPPECPQLHHPALRDPSLPPHSDLGAAGIWREREEVGIWSWSTAAGCILPQGCGIPQTDVEARGGLCGILGNIFFMKRMVRLPREGWTHHPWRD